MNEAVVSPAAQVGKLDGIFDILPPATPILSANNELLILLITGLLILALIAVIAWRTYADRIRARHELRALARLLRQPNIDCRQASYQLAGILRNGLKLNRLSPDTRLPSALASDQSRWQQFVQLLANARYSRNGSDAELLNQLVHESRYWLRRWP